MPAYTTEPNFQHGQGLIRVENNAQIDRRRSEEAKDKQEAERQQNEPLIASLYSYVQAKWHQAEIAKQDLEWEFVTHLNQRNGDYDDEQLQAIRRIGGCEVFIQLTDVKCRSAEGWIEDVVMPKQEQSWMLEPTPEPQLPPEIVQDIQNRAVQEEMAEAGSYQDTRSVFRRAQALRDSAVRSMAEEAQERCDRMSVKIADQLVEGGYAKAFDEFLFDIVTHKAAFLKGPVHRVRKKMVWGTNFTPKIANAVVPEYERVSPFDIYPGPQNKGINDGYIFERSQMEPTELAAFRDVPGYNRLAINLILEEYGRQGYRRWRNIDQDRAEAENRPQEYITNTDTIEILEYWGRIPGVILNEWGMDVDKYDSHEMNVWIANNRVIRAVMNPDPLGRRPYYKASYEEIPGSFWGKGIPEIVHDLQSICNAAVRAMVDNLGMASGPQVAITDIDRLPPGENITNIFPRKVWQFNNKFNSTVKPIEFYQPNPLAQELTNIYLQYAKIADEHTGIPAYAHGDTNVGGAGNTASGLSMLMSSAARGIKQVIANIDREVQRPLIQRQYQHNMINEKDQSIKGDMQVRAHGALSVLLKEQNQVQRASFMDMTNNETDMGIIGEGGRRKLLESVAQDMEIPDGVVPSEEDLKRKMEQRMIAESEALRNQAMMEAGGVPAGGPDQPPQQRIGA